MTDKELAEQSERKYYATHTDYNKHEGYIAGFLAGLKIGRPKWHDLREDPNDLPEPYLNIVNQDGEKVMYDHRYKRWRHDDADEYFCDTPIAWCELPTYSEEASK